MADDKPPKAADELWLPPFTALPGTQTMLYRNSQTWELVMLGRAKERRVYRVRAIVTDQHHPLNSSLEDLLAFQPQNRLPLPNGGFSLWKHYGGNRAVFFDLRSDQKSNLSAVEVEVSALRPELALAYARAAVNQLLDSLTATVPHPIIVQRLELLSPNDNQSVIAYQVTMPHQCLTNLPKFGGIVPSRSFSGLEAILREALTNPSPYYRLLLAFKGFEGLKRLRRQFPNFTKKHNVVAPPLTDIKLDKTEMAQHGFRDEALALDDVDQLIEHYKSLRDACAHFFVGGRSKAGRQQHLHLSSTLAHTCGRVAALMLLYVRRDLAYLKAYHRRFLAPITHLGMLLPMESARERFRVVCPDEEASGSPDDFNG
jgi:hypothetical protein